MLISAIEILLLIIAGLLFVPTLVLLIEVVIACAAKRRPRDTSAIFKGKVAVIMPAHNESAGLEATLTKLNGQLPRLSDIHVVADNCTDDTADIARRCGATVYVRSDTERRGRGMLWRMASRCLRRILLMLSWSSMLIAW